MGNTIANQQQEITPPSTPRKIESIFERVIPSPGGKVITVIVDEQIQFQIDVTDPSGDLTCGWLLSEVTRKYSIALEHI